VRPSLDRRIAAEFFGTAFLVAAVVGSGIMAERLSGGNVAIALLANTIATGAALLDQSRARTSIPRSHWPMQSKEVCPGVSLVVISALRLSAA
jgi:glycerol uptake facilitator-like aquaporin